jgi:hypothetical protein
VKVRVPAGFRVRVLAGFRVRDTVGMEDRVPAGFRVRVLKWGEFNNFGIKCQRCRI